MQTASLKILISRVQDFANFELSPMPMQTVQSNLFKVLCLGSIGLDCVVRESCYEMVICFNSFVKLHGEEKLGATTLSHYSKTCVKNGHSIIHSKIDINIDLNDKW